MTLDAKLRWKGHVKKKRDELGLKYKHVHWLMGRRSVLSTHKKLVFYKHILKPAWTYGLQLWGCTKPSNISHNTQYLHQPTANLTKFQKGVYYSAIKIFNKLPHNEIVPFRNALKRLLLINSFYNSKEYFNYQRYSIENLIDNWF